MFQRLVKSVKLTIWTFFYQERNIKEAIQNLLWKENLSLIDYCDSKNFFVPLILHLIIVFNCVKLTFILKEIICNLKLKRKWKFQKHEALETRLYIPLFVQIRAFKMFSPCSYRYRIWKSAYKNPNLFV